MSSDRSKAEIEGILRRYGADQFMQGWEAGLGVVGFRINGFQVRRLLVIKAKLEAVEAGITSIEQEFLPNMVLPDNTTAGENMLPRLREINTSGHLPPMLPAAHPIALGPPTQ